jgi:hypothetical protein
MNKTIERVITAGMIAVLATAFFQVAHATNESDYKYGFEMGKGEYQQCSSTHTCTVSENLLGVECEHYTGPNFGSAPTYNVDNETACNHGYFHGWIHECLNDGGGAICKYQPGSSIIAAITGPGHCYNTKKEGETCESGNFIPTH